VLSTRKRFSIMTLRKPIPSYKGAMAPFLTGLVQEKRAVGYAYNKQASRLKRFNDFCLSEGYNQPALTKEIVLLWTQKQPHENQSNRATRISLMRVLGSYMVRMGAQAFIYPKHSESYQENTYIPYIFTHAQLSRFFGQVDQLQANANSPFRQRIYPLLFRLLYGCGLRISEALHLTVEDVNLSEGLLRIVGGKTDRDRLVPMAASLVEHCHAYRESVHVQRRSNAVFFPPPRGAFLSPNTPYTVFRECLWKSGISHGGRGKGPRVHDLRHTFAVHCLKKWVIQGVDLTSTLPLLSAYMGHTGLKSTQRYLRLTAELYPDIVAAVERQFGNVVLGDEKR